ncbi:uncharacterized protein EAE97_002033 [Botrytis byssoidea]|uniref:Uncharacterized protein n=1 Tax=Botrytis byssoidea TaxID=139641 RepID=A0A9P5ISZ6_9HELO|nr:uncharacterized protein EAE97_002033 [Botrytis byssoidea]KAF7952536.1 hypothetical protein EAE97_002033 [Botrytis byssoidea]
MTSVTNSKTPPPRLMNIKPLRPQSMGTPSSINPTLLSRRRTSRSHNHGTIDTVPELVRFNSSGTKSSGRTRPRQTTSQSYGSLDTTSPRRERETMKYVSEFLMSYDPPAHNLVALPQTAPRKKFGLLRRKQKKESKSNQFLKLPDTAIAAKTRQGVQYIAISIPLEHDYLGRLQTPPQTTSNLARVPTPDRSPVIIPKPGYNSADSSAPPPELPVHKRTTSTSNRNTWGPGTLTKVVTKPGSEEVMLQNGYIHRTSQVYTPTGSIYHDAPESRPRPHSSKAFSSPVASFKVAPTDNPRANSLNSVNRPILWRNRSDGPLRVINRTPSPDTKPAYQTHKVIKSISTIHSIATTGTNIRHSLKSTPDSFNTNFSAQAVFGTAETVNLQSFRGTPRPSIASPRSENIIQFPAVSAAKVEDLSRNQATAPAEIASPISPQFGSNEKQADQAKHQSRREKVRAKKEKDLASIRSRNSSVDHTNINTNTNTNKASVQPVPEYPFIEAEPLSPLFSNPTFGTPDRFPKRLAPNTNELSTIRITLVADFPPYNEELRQCDFGARPISPALTMKSPSRIPRPKFDSTNSFYRVDSEELAYAHQSTQTILSHTSPLASTTWLGKERDGRKSSDGFGYGRMDLCSDEDLNYLNGDAHGKIDRDTSMNLNMERRSTGEIGTSLRSTSLKEKELDLRMRIVERHTDVLLRALGGVAKSFDGLGAVGRLRWEEVHEGRGVGIGFRSSVIGMGGSDGERSNRVASEGTGNRRRANTTGMGVGMQNRDRDSDIDLVMREIRMAAPRVSEESSRERRG